MSSNQNPGCTSGASSSVVIPVEEGRKIVAVASHLVRDFYGGSLFEYLNATSDYGLQCLAARVCKQFPDLDPEDCLAILFMESA